jgi:hypothetical protein
LAPNRLYILSDFILINPEKDHFIQIIGRVYGGGYSVTRRRTGAILLLTQEILLV